MLKLPKKKLVSLLTSATLAAGVVAAPTAFGLGLGNPAVESYIGEPLRVRIPVSVASEAELEALKVRIAGADWYSQAGIDRDPVVDFLLVGIERSGDSANVLITSADGLDQVMLPLLLEVSGPGMTLRKQVSVLLNPNPVARSDDPWQDPRVEVSGVIGMAPPQLASTSTVTPGSGESSPGSAHGISSQPVEAATPLVPEVDAGLEAAWPPTVRVQPGDSLSTVVNNLLPAGATRFQGRMAFYDRNPEAFEQGDIHRLKADVVMVVPSPDDILAVPRGEALARYQLLTTPVSLSEPESPTETPVPEVEVADAPASIDTDTAISLAAMPENAMERTGGSGFRLSLHDAPMELLPESLPSTDSPVSEASPLTDRPDTDRPAADESLVFPDGEQVPRMQGFSLRMDALNAYIIELQDENRFLKQRVASLEGNVNRLNNELASLNSRILTVESGAGSATPIEPVAVVETPIQGVDAPLSEEDPGQGWTMDGIVPEGDVDEVTDVELTDGRCSGHRGAGVGSTTRGRDR